MTALSLPDLDAIVAGAITRSPEWIRRDLASPEPRTREQAEVALAAVLCAAIRKDRQSG